MPAGSRRGCSRSEAYVGLALGACCCAARLQLARVDAASGGGSRFSAEMLLVLGALFCIVAGYFAVQPMIEAARAGQGGLSFGRAARHRVGVLPAQVGCWCWRWRGGLTARPRPSRYGCCAAS